MERWPYEAVVTMVFDFDAFETDFRKACLKGVRLLARTYNAAPFYAVCVYVDGFDGDFGLYANTEDAFSRTLEKYRAEYPERYAETAHVRALRYNCGDWAYQSFHHPADLRACVGEEISTWSERVYDLSYNQDALTDEHYQLFDEVACRIALSVPFTQEVMTLKRTDDFLVTVSGHDESAFACIYRPMWYADKGSLDGFDPMAYSEYD